MATSVSLTLIWVAIFVYTLSADCNDPIRRRKSWYHISQDERDDFANALISLANEGKLAKFTEQHASESSFKQAYHNSAFLPWNRYFIWELETQIRNLGGEYECFSLPYWDWTVAIDEQLKSSQGKWSGSAIFKTGLGGAGDLTDRFCVNDGPFRKGNYVPYDTSNTDDNGTPCLARWPNDDPGETPLTVAWPSVLAIIIGGSSDGMDPREYGKEQQMGFRRKLEIMHDKVQAGVGGKWWLSDGVSPDGVIYQEYYSPLYFKRYGPDDPIFWLIHSYVDYVWALWQDCWDYDLMVNPITTAAYDGIFGPAGFYGPSRLYDLLIFDVLEATEWANFGKPNVVDQNGDGFPDSFTNGLRIRDMHNIRDWNVRYEHAFFFEVARNFLEAACTGDLNSNIFSISSFSSASSNSSNNDAECPDFSQYASQELLGARNSTVSEEGTWGVIYNKDLSTTTAQLITSSFARISCEMGHGYNGGIPCIRPKCFDDCSDLVDPCDDEEPVSDINVTLDELIEKVADYPCMVQTRRNMYEYAKNKGDLLGLCRGDYDNFCDGNSIAGKTTLDTCSISDDELEDTDHPGPSPGRGKYGKKDKRGTYGKSAYSGIFQVDYDGEFGSDNDKKFASIFDYNTLMIVIVIVFNVIGCFYLDYKWKRKLQKEGMKYVDHDDI